MPIPASASMASFLYLTSCVHYIFIGLAFLASAAVCDDCLPPTISKDPIVGFDISLTYGTSAIVFPNGTLVNVALVEANADYQAWITRSLRDVLNNESHRSIDVSGGTPEVESSHGSFMCIFRQSLAKRLQSGFGSKKSTADATDVSKVKLQEQEGLKSLLGALKKKTEAYLGKEIAAASITVSGFFNSTQRVVLWQALDDVSIQSHGCFEKNDLAAALAQRHSQFHFSHKTSNSTSECILGPFGVEEVISIAYTGNILTFSHYDLYVGYQTAFEMHDEYFVALRNLTANANGAEIAEGQGDVFWQNVESSIRTLVVERRHIRRRTARLTISRPSSQDPDLLNTLRSALGETIPPNSDNPRAVHIVLTEEESTHNYEEESRRRSQLSCLYVDYSTEWVLKDYEDDLLALVDLPDEHNDGKVDIDPRFNAARGAALLGLASHTLPCKRRSAMRVGFWSDWDFFNRKEGKYLHFPGCDESKEEWCMRRQDASNVEG